MSLIENVTKNLKSVMSVESFKYFACHRHNEIKKQLLEVSFHLLKAALFLGELLASGTFEHDN